MRVRMGGKKRKEAAKVEAEDSSDEEVERDGARGYDVAGTAGDEADVAAAVRFEDMGLDARLLKPLAKRRWTFATAVQSRVIPVALAGGDVVAQACTGSGKTVAYLVPALQKAVQEATQRQAAAQRGSVSERWGKLMCVVLVPTRELCHQVYRELRQLTAYCTDLLSVCELTGDSTIGQQRMDIAARPNLIVATPGRLCVHLREGSFKEAPSLRTLVLDEADLLLGYGCGDDVSEVARRMCGPDHEGGPAAGPRGGGRAKGNAGCQIIVTSATLGDRLEDFKDLQLRSPSYIKVEEDRQLTPKTLSQYVVRTGSDDKWDSRKLLYLFALLRFQMVPKKVMVFVNDINKGYRVRLFLEQFGFQAGIINAEMPQNARLLIIERFNRGLFDYLIATDGDLPAASSAGKHAGRGKRRKLSDNEYSAARGLDYKQVKTVVCFDMAENWEEHQHRIGRTGRANQQGTAVSLVSEEDAPAWATLQEQLDAERERLASDAGVAALKHDEEDLARIPEFPIAWEDVKQFEYRVEDISRRITSAAVREARIKELEDQLTKSEKLREHFEHNPEDLDLIKGDNPLVKPTQSQHLKHVPGYLANKKLKSAIPQERDPVFKGAPVPKRPRNKGASADPLKDFSARGSTQNLRDAKEAGLLHDASIKSARKKYRDKHGIVKGNGINGRPLKTQKVRGMDPNKF